IGLAGGQTARADDVEAARQHFAQGSKAFDLGLYDQAIKEYMAAYGAKPDPAMLYNIAQAHKLAGRPDQAVRFYRTYLSRVPDAENADEVRAKITELQKAIDQQQRAQSMPPDHVKAPESAVPAPVAKTNETAPPTATVDGAAGSHRGRTHKIVGGAVAGVGVVALGVGIGLSVKAKQDADQLSAIDAQGGVYDPSKESTGRALGTAGPALIGVGAAAIVVGGVLFLIGHRAAQQPRTMAAAR
ncbi:MAG TPA: tetratricopeptide repeat protein, partial [Polyangia bacterium]